MNGVDGFLKRFLSPWTILGGFVLAFVLFGVLLALLWELRPEQRVAPSGTSMIYIIEAPTITEPAPNLPPTPTPTPEADIPDAPPAGIIVIGSYVQISGTGVDGLRLRSAPGLDQPIKFVGIESEVFRIADGPKDQDGYIWFYLIAPYDETVRGWAVSNYLLPIQAP